MRARSNLCRSLTIALLSAPFVASLGLRAHAQRRPPVPRVPAQSIDVASASASVKAPSAAPTNGTGSLSAPTASVSDASPLPPDLAADPMLVPVPAAPRVVSGWREALSMVRARSTNYRIALSNVMQAEGSQRVALANLLPTITAGANVYYQAVRPVQDGLAGGIVEQTFPTTQVFQGALQAQLVQPVFAPRAWYALGTTDQNKWVQQLSLEDTKRTLAAALAAALVNVITDERVAELNRVALRTALERLALTRRRAELGAATGLDVLRTEQDATSTRAAIVTGDENLRQAREALGMALGYAEAFGVPRDIDLDAFARDSQRACSRSARVEDRPDVAAAVASAEVQRRGIHDVELQFYPTVNLVATLQRTYNPFVALNVPVGVAQDGMTPVYQAQVHSLQTYTTWNIGAVLNWTIWDGGARYGNLTIARANTDEADAAAEATRRAATIQIAQATRAVEVAEASLKVAQLTRDQARETDRLARLNFELGRGTSLDLVDAARQLRQAEIQLAVQEFNTIQSKIAALLALSTCTY